MYVCLCLCLSLYGREVTVGYARLRGSMGATFCHLAALRSAIEFLFWDHWETAVLGQILAGRSREQISAIWRHFDHGLRYHDMSLRNQKDSGSGLAFAPRSQVFFTYKFLRSHISICEIDLSHHPQTYIYK